MPGFNYLWKKIIKNYILTKRTKETKVKKVAASTHLALDSEIAVEGLMISGKNYENLYFYKEDK